MKRLLPAYPLLLKSPNFSFWSCGDFLNESNVQTWFGEEKKIYGFLKTKGKTFCFLGNANDFADCNVTKCKQTDLQVSLFSTEYKFLCGDNRLTVKFISPLPLNDLNLLSMPTTFIEYQFDGEGEISFFVNRNVGYNKSNKNNLSLATSFPLKKCEVGAIGLKRQTPLSNNDDTVGADWGYYYISGQKVLPLNEDCLRSYLLTDKKEFNVDGEELYVSSFNTENKGKIIFAYDEGIAINYFGDYLKGLYLENNNIIQAIEFSYTNFTKIKKQLTEFEKPLIAKAEKISKNYARIVYASYRQTVAGHIAVKDKEDNLLFLSKECGSNGCIATLDVTYPSMPLFLLYNTELIKGMIRPIIKFSKMPVWKYDFAPHDVGTYPNCCGQVYSLNKVKTGNLGNYYKDGKFQTHFPLYLLPPEFDTYSFDRQMPVEECANMLIILYACYLKDKDISFFKSCKDLCDKWVKYLVKYGLYPEEQLCTDDFAGHLKNNVNLAIKATVGIACYGKLLEAVKEKNGKYISLAVKYAKKIENFGKSFSHLPISWDTGENTYSLKYNLVFDKILKLNLFSNNLFEKETAYYIKKLNEFGTPLDSRKDYLKSDWLIWVSYFADKKNKDKLIDSVINFLEKTKERIPFADWYDSLTGNPCILKNQNGSFKFRARTVQGGCFILLLK